MGFSSYRGGFGIAAGLKPDGDSGFPLMESCDIQVDEDGQRLDQWIADHSNGVGINLDDEISEQNDIISLLSKAVDNAVNYQAKTDSRLATDSKNIVGAINELSKNFRRDTAAYQRKTDANLKTTSRTVVGAINEINAKVENIKATGGVADNGIVGTWVFNDALTLPDSNIQYDIDFTYNEVKCSGMALFSDSVTYYLSEDAYDVYEAEDGWSNEIYKTIVILTEPADDTFASWLKANATKEEYYQTKKDDSLKTESKDIVGAINEVNEKIGKINIPEGTDAPTVDEIITIDTWYDTPRVDDTFEEGITWADRFGLETKEDGYVEGDIYHKIPLVAGDNVTFEKTLTEGGVEVVKISVTSGGSSTDDSMVGTWVVIDEPEIPTTEMPLSFTSNGETFTVIGSTYMGSSDWNIKAVTYVKANGEPSVVYANNPSGDYGIQHGWLDAVYKTITVIEEPSAEVAAWIRANAVKQEDAEESGGVSFSLPFIRYANFKNLKDEEDNIVGYRFTVENLGGGTLQVGDKLQICCRRRYTGGKYKLRQMAERLITEEDIGQRFLKIEVPNAEFASEKWLFKNDRNGPPTLSAMYFRLKRVTAYNESGFECNAIFSNVEQVWKTYNLDSHVLNIK